MRLASLPCWRSLGWDVLLSWSCFELNRALRPSPAVKELNTFVYILFHTLLHTFAFLFGFNCEAESTNYQSYRHHLLILLYELIDMIWYTSCERLCQWPISMKKNQVFVPVDLSRCRHAGSGMAKDRGTLRVRRCGWYGWGLETSKRSPAPALVFIMFYPLDNMLITWRGAFRLCQIPCAMHHGSEWNLKL